MKEVDIISEGIAIIILSIIGFSIENYLKASKELKEIPRTIIEGILLYMTGLVVVEKKASCNKMSEALGAVSHDKLTRTLNGAEILIGKLGIIAINYCLSKPMGGFLIIDDVLIPKQYASKIEGAYNEYDHVEKKKLMGMRIVVIIWSNGKIRIPIAWAIWHKEDKELIGFTSKGQPKYRHSGQCLIKIDGQSIPYKTKNKIATELLEQVLSKGLEPDYLTFDSWYCSKNNLKAFQLLSLTCYTRLKSNRLVIYKGRKMHLQELSQQFDISSFNHKHDAYIKSVEVFLPGFRNVKLLIVRKDKHAESGRNKYLISTDLSATASQILLKYRSRWLIETFFRDIKQNLDLGSCQARGIKQQNTHLALVFFAFMILEIEPTIHFNGEIAETIGEKKKLLSSLLLLKSFEYDFVLDIRHNNSKPIALTDSNLDKVYHFKDFASEIINYRGLSHAA